MNQRLLTVALCMVLVLGLAGSVVASEYIALSVGQNETVTIDGDLSDWIVDGEFVVPAIVLNEKAQAVRGDSAWQGPEDSSGKVYFRWTKDYLLVAADVVDDKGTLGGRPDNGDSVGVTIIVDGIRNLITEMTPYPPDGDWSKAVLFREGGPWTSFPSNTIVRATEKADGQGYYLEAAIPWSDLTLQGNSVDPMQGSVLFNVIISDSDDGSSRKSVLLNTRSESNPVTAWVNNLDQFMPLVLTGDGAGSVVVK